ncbi:anti-sigma-28 factor, FlgM family [Oryzisolibacter propanilivorax]|uniref:Negative regulator of flagellin synthesis n=1 Tax=Oryzisolibacter propanilivorax TaxID=1527607 RepID=A0A1G9V5N2_9BURK|nr:flagellar biosynthesis anti-sigma factor FlgM [Oryzisolibacter propanilivorax]SDM67390.1 anti-sigma-28 factor, FlgM family [Oryzisolibacter propanilivorax]
MKITGNNPELTNARSAQATAARQQGKAAAPAPAAEAAAQGATRLATGGAAAAGVPVTLSSAARGVEGSRGTGDFDAAKVKAVKAAIENGTFRVDAEAVADKLLANAYETLSRSSSQG